MATWTSYTVMWYICSFLQLGSAQDITCTVTHDATQTTYNVSDVSHASNVMASDCEYSWTNVSNYVLANQKAENATLVIRNSISILITSKCFNNIIFKRSCISERTEYIGNCSTNCSGNDSFLKDKDTVGDAYVYWIAGICVPLMVFGIVYWKCKELKKKCCCNQNGDIYTNVNVQNTELRMM